MVFRPEHGQPFIDRPDFLSHGAQQGAISRGTRRRRPQMDADPATELAAGGHIEVVATGALSNNSWRSPDNADHFA